MIWKPWSHPAWGRRDFIRVPVNGDNIWVSVFLSGDRWWVNTSIWARDSITKVIDEELRRNSSYDSGILKKFVDKRLVGLGHTLVDDEKKLIML